MLSQAIKILFNSSNLKVSSKHREGRFLSLLHKTVPVLVLARQIKRTYFTPNVFTPLGLFFSHGESTSVPSIPLKYSLVVTEETLVHAAVSAQLYLPKNVPQSLQLSEKCFLMKKSNDKIKPKSLCFYN